MTAMRPARGVFHGRRAVAGGVLLVCVLVAGALWRRTSADDSLIAIVHRGDLTSVLTTTGSVMPARALTYRSPIAGRETEILSLVPEGTRVAEGDAIARLDTTELQRDVDRVAQDLRALQLELQVAHGERQEAEGHLAAVIDGEGALGVEEARTRLQLAERRAERLRAEHAGLQPLLARGFITRDELARSASDLEQAEEDLSLARRRAAIAAELTHPREKQRASLQVAQKQSRVEHVVGQVQEAEHRLRQLRALVEAATIRARGPGLVVYEVLATASPRRKVRVGDRVTSSQGLVTIPEVGRMLVEASVGESDVHRVRAGQAAVVRLEAFPDLRLTGRVARVGTLATAAADRPHGEKRFDLVIALDESPDALRPEMTARADVQLGTRAGVLLVPVNAVFEQQGRFMVHLPGGRRPIARPVDLGESNDRWVEVVAGLVEGDRVVLDAVAPR